MVECDDHYLSYIRPEMEGADGMLKDVYVHSDHSVDVAGKVTAANGTGSTTARVAAAVCRTPRPWIPPLGARNGSV